MHVLFAGNSHLGALKTAWNGAGKMHLPNAHATFLGAHTDSLRKVYCSDGRFRTDDPAVRRALVMTTGLRDPELPIGSFDCFFLHGLYNSNWIVPYTLRAKRHIRSHGVISSGLVKAVANEILGRSVMNYMVGVIRDATDAPIVISPQPFRSQAILDSPIHRRRYVGHEQLNTASSPDFWNAFDEAIHASAQSKGFSILSQPTETIVAACFTAHEFCRDSVRLTPGLNLKHPGEDFDHMNEAYGTLVFRDLSRFLRTGANLACRSE